MRSLLALALGLVLLPSCSGPSTCGINFTQGWITIQSASIKGGPALKQVTISNVRSSGGLILTGMPGVINLTARDGKYVCDVACSFGQAGTYTFDVSAPGALTQTVTVTVPERVTGRGGCGASEISGERQTLNLELEPLTN